VDLESFTIAMYDRIDTILAEMHADPDWTRIRQRGPAPTLADSEVLAMEVVGEFLGLDRDTALYAYFRREHPDWFPGLLLIHRTTFARQAANLWVVKEQVWQRLLDQIPHDPALSFVDSVPVPVCRFGRAYHCSRFREHARFGRDTGSHATFYGLRAHLRACWPGVIPAFTLASANVHDLHLVPELVDDAAGQVIGDRNYWDPKLTAELARAGIQFQVPFKRRDSDPDPAGSRLLTRWRWRIEVVASQLVERYHLKRVWARDAWHLTSRVLRKVLSHTLCVGLCLEQGLGPLHFDGLLTP
jgi:Transposase DDE domain